MKLQLDFSRLHNPKNGRWIRSAVEGLLHEASQGLRNPCLPPGVSSYLMSQAWPTTFRHHSLLHFTTWSTSNEKSSGDTMRRESPWHLTRANETSFTRLNISRVRTNFQEPLRGSVNCKTSDAKPSMLWFDQQMLNDLLQYRPLCV
jgi:hypothetical protein